MKLKALSYTLLCISIISCSQSSERTNSSTKIFAGNSLKQDSIVYNNQQIRADSFAIKKKLHKIAEQAVACLFKPLEKYKIIAHQLKGGGDSILFASENHLFQYPLGHFNSVTQVTKKFPGLTCSYVDKNSDSTGMIRVYTFKNGSSFFKMFPSQESSHSLNLSSGLITTPNIKVFDRIFVGMSKKSFLNIFFHNYRYNINCPCKVYSFAYVVDSQIQHFTFIDDKLVKIQFNSYYIVD